MNELISLQCPNCGGIIQVGKEVNQFQCEYCGTVHLLKDHPEGSLKAYPVCPCCGRRDQVKGVPAVLARNPHLAKWLRRPRMPANLAKARETPRPPELRTVQPVSRGSVFLQAAGLISLAVFVWLLVAGRLSDLFGAAALLFVTLLGYLSLRIRMENVRNIKEVNQQLLSDYQAEVESFERYLQQPASLKGQRAAIVNLLAWRRACLRWEQLYCCERDDVVFLPGEAEYKSLAEINRILYNN